MNIYVGNLSYSLSEEDLKAAFSQFGRRYLRAMLRPIRWEGSER
jgi:hypothetical protein